MAFTVSDYQDLLKLLREHPEWRAELRQEILDEEFLRLPEYVRQNSADIRQNSADIRELKESIVEMREAVIQLGRLIERNVIRTDFALGAVLEVRYSAHPEGYFGKLLRAGRTVAPRELPRFVSADEAAEISDAEAESVRLLDIIVQGVQGRGSDRRDAWLAVEVSMVIDVHDVDRAAERAAVLRKVGYDNTIAVVVGALISPPVAAYAEKSGVQVQIDKDARLVATTAV